MLWAYVLLLHPGIAVQVQTSSAVPERCLCPYCKAYLHVSYRGPRSASERSGARDEQQRIFEALSKARLVCLVPLGAVRVVDFLDVRR